MSLITRLKQRVRAVLKEAGGSEDLAHRVGALERDVLARLDSIEQNLDARLRQIEIGTAALEELTHGARATYVGDNRVLVKIVLRGANIAYLVQANDLLLSPWFIVTGGYETELTNYFLRELKSDSHCLDVGTNFGYFTCLMARFCPQGLVVGVEADDQVFALVRDNININGFGDFASVINAAASDSAGELTLHRRVTRSGATSITKVWDSYLQSIGEPSTQPFTVASVRIDDLATRFNGRLDFMKVDVEGAEPLVFEGARETIAANPGLNIVMEWSPGQIRDAGFDVPKFLEALAGMDLTPYDILTDMPTPVSYDEVSNMAYRAGILLRRSA